MRYWLLVMLLSASPAWATTYYVDLTAGTCTGNYSIAARNCTGSDGNSYATIAAGITPTVAGDTLYLRAGTYTGQRLSIVGKVGTSSAKYTISGYQAEVATVATTATGATSSTNRNILVSGSQYVTIQNLVFDGVGTILSPSNSNPSGPTSISNTIESSSNIVFDNVEIKNTRGLGWYITTSGITIRNSYVHDAVTDCIPGTRWLPIYFHDGSTAVIEGNRFYNMPGAGMQLYPGPITGATIRKNHIKQATNGCSNQNVGGVLVWAESGNISGVTINNNVIETIGVGGGIVTSAIDLGPVTGSFTLSGTTVYNNTLYNSVTGYGIIIRARASGTVVKNNLVTGSALGAILNAGASTTLTYNACTAGETCTTANKITITAITDCTISTSDFHLKSGAPCINAGTTLATVTDDFDGVSRPQGAAYDIGAYEYVGDSTPPAVPTGVTITRLHNVDVPEASR